jgi:hypothetical protein
MDVGQIWTLSNKEVRFCKNISLDRKMWKNHILSTVFVWYYTKQVLKMYI